MGKCTVPSWIRQVLTSEVESSELRAFGCGGVEVRSLGKRLGHSWFQLPNVQLKHEPDSGIGLTKRHCYPLPAAIRPTEAGPAVVSFIQTRSVK